MTFEPGQTYPTPKGPVTVEELVPREPRLRCSDGLWRHSDGRCFDNCGSDWDLMAVEGERA